MGYNSTLMINNDSMHEIEKDPLFGLKVVGAMYEWQRTHRIADISSGCSVNAASFLGTFHADVTAVYAVGGNYGSLIGTSFGHSHHEKEKQVALLKRIADDLGYVLHKKPTRG